MESVQFGKTTLDLTQTARLLSEACDSSFDAAAEGKSAAMRSRCHYVNEKWLGGTLTNRSTTETRSKGYRFCQ